MNAALLALPVLALALAASVSYTVLLETPAIDGCRSFQASPSVGPLHVVFPGQCNVIVECTDFATEICE